LTSISGSSKTNSKGRGRLRWSLRIERILGWKDTTVTGLREILLENVDLLLPKWLARCSENQYIKSWKKSRINHTLNGEIRWEETL